LLNYLATYYENCLKNQQEKEKESGKFPFVMFVVSSLFGGGIRSFSGTISFDYLSLPLLSQEIMEKEIFANILNNINQHVENNKMHQIIAKNLIKYAISLTGGFPFLAGRVYHRLKKYEASKINELKTITKNKEEKNEKNNNYNNNDEYGGYEEIKIKTINVDSKDDSPEAIISLNSDSSPEPTSFESISNQMKKPKNKSNLNQKPILTRSFSDVNQFKANIEECITDMINAIYEKIEVNVEKCLELEHLLLLLRYYKVDECGIHPTHKLIKNIPMKVVTTTGIIRVDEKKWTIHNRTMFFIIESK